MLQAQWTKDGVDLVDVDPPPLRAGWARLRVAACGICGSDLHFLRNELPRVPGMAPGHEIVGYPTDGPAGLGETLYAVEPRTWCGACGQCVSGRRHLCERGTLIGIGLPGGMGEFVDAPVEALHPVDPAVPALAASIAEPLAVCVRAVHLGELEASSRVLVQGAGSIGLLTALLARDRAAAVGITARHPHQRAAAERIGVEPLAEDDVGAWAGEGSPDVVIETVGGRADTLDQAVALCRPAGRVVVLGVFAGARPVNAFALMAKELTVVGSNTYGTVRRGSEFGGAVDLIPRYRAEIDALQTHQFPLKSLRDAFECADRKRDGAVKVTLMGEA